MFPILLLTVHYRGDHLMELCTILVHAPDDDDQHTHNTSVWIYYNLSSDWWW